MYDEWTTAAEISKQTNIPVETVRRYFRQHGQFLRIRKLHKKYLIHPDSAKLIPQIRDIYAAGKSVEEVESYLESKGSPLTVTVDSESPSSHERDERLEKQLLEMAEKMDKQEEFNRLLLERLDQQQKYINSTLKEQERRLNERDQQLAESLKQLQEEKQARLETTNVENPSPVEDSPKKEGFFRKLFKP